ncbi:hypothetical protein E3N88_20286 [Mikania micrantha]|uniref:RBR-type E3 ubiquitin transferase n=1 Tax=Mikania micrantha TaxID=192012 RepID=A0A5N6NIE8_9ASTR|nr:hypothetical protein E3N88_20286 [Mikania micrantha]
MQPMDSDRLLQYTFSLYSDDQDYYDEFYADDDDDDDYDVGDITDDCNVLVNRVNCTSEKSYVILKEDDLLQRLEEDITNVTTVLSIPRDSACMMLLRYNWDVNGVWRSYVSTAIDDGPGCLNLRCPEPSCDAAVGPDMIKVLATANQRKRYELFLLRTYVESNKMIKWCPGPGCDYAIEFDDDFETGSYDVSCFCKYGFCWKCMEDAHRPLDCETVAKWVLKNNAEAENTNWILAYTKPCPKCKRSIEKNHGCMHMTCRPPCGYDFVGYVLANTGGMMSKLVMAILKGEAESGLERLHHCAEKELQAYIIKEDADATEEQFNCFRVKLSDLTSVTRSYFENLVRALENGLSDVDSHEAPTKGGTGSDQGAAGGSSSKVRVRVRRGLIRMVNHQDEGLRVQGE